MRREDLEKAIEENVHAKDDHSLIWRPGEIVSVFIDMVERGADQTAKRIADHVDTRYILIPGTPGRESYERMELFIETVKDPKLAAELKAAIEGEGAFRKFREALRMHRTELDRWYDLKDERLGRAVEGFLNTKGLADKVELI